MNKESKDSSNNYNYLQPTLFESIKLAGGINKNSDLKTIKVIRVNSIT